MATTALEVHFAAGFGGTAAVRVVHLFADKAAAEAVFGQLRDAVAAYHNRANDRERICTFETLGGSAAVDVSQVSAIGVDDAFGENRAAVEEWNTNVGTLRGKADAATAAVKEAV